MPVASSILFAAALAFAVVIGPQTRPWTWGPAMLCLAGAALAAVPAFWKRGKAAGDFGLMALGTLAAAWFAWRAWISPVHELGQADLLLLGSAVAAFVSVRAISGHPAAERILAWGIGLLLLASLAVVGKQLADASFSPVFRTKAAENAVTGFFGHYIDGSNFLVATSMMTAAWALFGRDHRVIRIVWLLIAIGGIVAVRFTHARGGILGAALAGGAFVLPMLVIGYRRNAKWFVPALIASPIIGIALGAFLFLGWSKALEARNISGGVENVMDNDGRLHLLGTALSCISEHPAAGGGARSFAWESFQMVTGKDQGGISARRPEFVHNEFVQAATDYGLIGAGLLLALLGTILIGGVLRLMFEDRQDLPDAADAWRIGAFAALGGLLVQACFGFVIHLLPGALLLGIVLAQFGRSRSVPPGPATMGTGILLSITGLACATLLAPAGWAGLRTTHVLWATYYGKEAETSDEARIEALTEALAIWPHSFFHHERASLHQTLAGAPEHPGFANFAEQAIADYAAASRLHPFEPGFVVNRANLLSQLGRDAEAEDAYREAIRLQGGMEPGFRGHFSFAHHYLRKGLRLYDTGNPEPSLDALERAAAEIETAFGKMHWVLPDMREPRVSIHENLGAARESANDAEGALQSYDFAAKLQGGQRVHYRAGVLTGKIAVEAWSKRRPAEAMKQFIEAKRRVAMAGDQLPAGVSPSQSVEYKNYLDRSIEFLKGAKVTPAP